MYGGREALPDDHKFRGQRGRVRARYRRPQLGRGTEKIGETSQRKTNLQLASGAFSCKVAPFTPAGERTKKAPSRGGRTGSNGQQHPVVIDCEVLQKRRSRCTTPGELRTTRRKPLLSAFKPIGNEKRAAFLRSGRRRSRPSVHKLSPALSISPSTNYPGPLSDCIPGRAIPEAQRVRRAPPNELVTSPPRTQFCAIF
jgi:hypothetical protein